MPIYEYRCNDCNQTFEELRSIKDSDVQIHCSHCESEDTFRFNQRVFQKSLVMPLPPLTLMAAEAARGDLVPRVPIKLSRR